MAAKANDAGLSTTGVLVPFKDWIKEALGDPDSLGRFATDDIDFGALESFPPQLQIDGIGEVSLPLNGEKASQLAAAGEAAPFGRGLETVLDETVRKAKQFDAKQIHLSAEFDAGKCFHDPNKKIIMRGAS